MKKEIEIQRIRKRYLKEIVCQSRKWLVMAGIAMLILSIYNIVISWLLQTIIDIVSGDSSMTILQVGIIAMITFLIFIIFMFTSMSYQKWICLLYTSPSPRDCS